MAVADDADAGTAADEAHRVVAANTFMTLATADGDGRPWATPVWFAARDCAEFVWLSRPGARHSVNIAGRPRVGIVVHDPGASAGPAAVYVEADADEVTPADRADALAVLNSRARERGLRTYGAPDVTGAAQFRLYRARTRRIYVLDEHDGRVEVR